MIIYGTALLAFCHLAGLFLGDLLGSAIGVKTNVGGVGIAMLLLICLRLWLHRRGWLPKRPRPASVSGARCTFPSSSRWPRTRTSSPLKGGPVALLAAVGAVAICACCIAVLVRTGRDDTAFAGVPQFEER